MSKKKTALKLIFLLIFLTPILLAFVAFTWWKDVNKPVNPIDTTDQKIIIPKGSGSIAIGELLESKGIIKSKWGFRLLVDRLNYESKLQAGSYTLNKSQNLKEIIETLTKGSEDFWVTIPEGKRREEIALILFNEFEKNDLPFSIPDFLESSKELEGYLFPDTYLIPRTMTEEEIVNLMRATFDEKIPDELKIKANKLNLEFGEALILASLVEREAKYDVDRSKIAGVLINRLQIQMPLQIDATVQYALGSAQCITKTTSDCNWWPQITETEYKSPYNTYKVNSLPPAPICNPGIKVIEAILNPDSHDYLYYVSEPSGTTHYAKTLEEHETNIQKYLN
jgi:UPF0755 protein